MATAESGKPSSIPTPSTNPFDPLTDIVGLPRDESSTTSHPQPRQTQGQHFQNSRPVHMRPTIDQSTEERVHAAKNFVGMNGANFSSTQNHSFGVTGANRHASLHPNKQQINQQQYQLQQQQQHQYTMMQMQMYATYNMAVYNTYSNMAQTQAQPQQQQQQLAIYQPQHQGPIQTSQMLMVPYGGFSAQQNPGFGGTDASKVTPVMETHTTAELPQKAFRVQKKTTEEFVSEDDKAFKPLFEEFKSAFTTSK